MHALDALTRRRRRKDGDGSGKPKGAAMTGRTAAYGRAAFAWAVKRGAVRVNPFADLPVAKGIAKRERVLSDAEIAEVWRAAGDAASPYGTIVRLLILTGQRRGEVAGMAGASFPRTWQSGHCRASARKTAPLTPWPQYSGADPQGGAARRCGRAARVCASGRLGTPFAGWSKAKRALDKAIEDARAEGAAAFGKAPRRLSLGACMICAAQSPPGCSALARGSKSRKRF